MAKTRFFRVAVEGATTDGRKIERKWLEDAAATYKPETYTALLNCEHIRGFSPDAPFNGYGRIVALKTEEIQIDIGGKNETRLALFAQIDANDQLVAINRKGQKLFSSVEIAPDFAGSGKAYLVGLAVTDSPASLGTEMLQFAASQGEKNPLAHRKQDKANLFTVAEEMAIEIDDATPVNADPTGIFASIKGLLDKFTPAGSQQEPKQDPVPAAPKADSGHGGSGQADTGLAAFGMILGQLTGAIEASNQATGEKIARLTADLGALTGKVEAIPASPFTQRPPATGGEAAVRTDC